jgi:hypothetical protein
MANSRGDSRDDEQQPTVGVLLLDEHGSATAADRLPADSAVSSKQAPRYDLGDRSVSRIAQAHATRSLAGR